VVAVTTLLSALIGFEHNATGTIEEIATPEARVMVNNYNTTSLRIEELNADSPTSPLACGRRRKSTAPAPPLIFVIGSICWIWTSRLPRRKTAAGCAASAHFILSAVRPKTIKPAALYQMDKAPAGLQTDGRQWHIKKIEKGEIKLVGGGEVVGTIPSGLPSFRLPAISVDGVLQLLTAALVIALVAFMESISMAKAMAGKVQAAHRPQPGTDRPGAGQHRRLLFSGLSGLRLLHRFGHQPQSGARPAWPWSSTAFLSPSPCCFSRRSSTTCPRPCWR
jgi:sulfate permease, SulP family